MTALTKTFPGALVFLALLASGCKHAGPSAEAGADSTTIPLEVLPLTDTADFVYSSPAHDNWSVAGEVYSDRHTVHSLETKAGEGVLVSRPTDSDKAELMTRFTHGDMDLELDFMMPRGSNSGIYFMGRYEVQLFDSWLKPLDSLKYGDCGGIYERMAGGRGYEGHAPIVNACKAPGLWQHLKVRFRAPRFDQAGNKTANATFVYVYLNGALVQQNIECTLPTLGSYYADEAPKGPLEIQGSHGPIALRNIRYHTYIPERIGLHDMELTVYKSLYANIDTLQTLTPDRVLHPDSLSQLSYRKYEQGVYRGIMDIPDTEDYIFKLQAGGPAWLWIDSALVVSNHRSGDYFTPWYKRIHLTRGAHHFRLIYNNRYQQFKLSYEATHIPRTSLTTISSQFPEPVPEPYPIAVTDRAVVQRCFMMHRGEKKTHVIAVGFPGKINYAYSLAGYNLLSVWRGGFIDAADMWRERGEQQLALPLGGLALFRGYPTVETLAGDDAPWLDSIPIDSAVYQHRSYQLQKNGAPVFHYTFNEAAVTDYIHPDSAGEGLVRELTVTIPSSGEHYYALIAAGSPVTRLPDGDYAIDDNSFYIAHLESAGSPQIIHHEGYDALVCPLKAGGSPLHIQYKIIW